jgi:hypothetical protein
MFSGTASVGRSPGSGDRESLPARGYCLYRSRTAECYVSDLALRVEALEDTEHPLRARSRMR